MSNLQQQKNGKTAPAKLLINETLQVKIFSVT